MSNKRHIKNAIEMCKKRIKLYEKKVEKLEDKIENVKAKYDEDEKELKEQLRSIDEEPYYGSDDDIYEFLRWFDSLQKKEAELREEITNVRVTNYTKLCAVAIP